MKEPVTLQQAIQYFSDLDRCVAYLMVRRWPDGVVCPSCGSRDFRFISTRRLWECKQKHPKRQFSVKVGTIFEDSAIGLDKWLTAFWMVANCRNGVSSYEIHRTIGVTQKSAWFMLHRIRLALQGGVGSSKLGGNGGEVEVDETFVGGRVANMHKRKKAKLAAIKNNSRGLMGDHMNKTIVMGMLDRDLREVRAKVIPNVRRDTLQGEILREISQGSKVYTDAYVGYHSLKEKEFVHEFVDHVEGYVDGRVHTNGIENFWSLLKRSLKGTYVAVEPFHMQRYVDEQAFRFNHRKGVDGKPLTDAERFSIGLSQIAGKRLTFAEVTGKVGETPF